jgi:ElaB/YqjD/DUF883 family membrane-anchored ribosome-binding protein
VTDRILDRPFRFEILQDQDLSMAWHSSRSEPVANIERLLHDLEARLARLSRNAARASSAAPRSADRIAEAVAGALAEIADRFRGRARSAGDDATHLRDDAAKFGNDALKFGNNTLRKLTHEVEQRPLVTLAIAAGIGALAVTLLARRD